MTAVEVAPVVDKLADPLYSSGEAARLLALPETTLRNWARGYRVVVRGRTVVGDAVVSTVPRRSGRGPDIPFVGLAEAYAVAAIRRAGVPMQRIRPALTRLEAELGLAHALASRQLFTDGAEVLFDYGERQGGDDRDAVHELVVVRDGQRVFHEVVEDSLRRIEFGTDGLASALPLPGFRRAELVADVRLSFGQPVFRSSGARLSDVVSLFRAERDVDLVAEEYGIDRSEVEDALAVLVS